MPGTVWIARVADAPGESAPAAVAALPPASSTASSAANAANFIERLPNTLSRFFFYAIVEGGSLMHPPFAQRFHSALPDHHRGALRNEEIDQPLPRTRLLRTRNDGVREYLDELDLRGNDARELDTGRVQDLAHWHDREIR